MSYTNSTFSKVCLFALFCYSASAKNITRLRYSSNNRELSENIVVIKKENCTFVNSVCKCPYSCYEQYKNENYCVAKKCYVYDENLAKCRQDGLSSTGPIVLQAIPFTGVFGSGFGNMGRWDMFGMYMGIFIGGFFGVLCLSTTILCLNTQDDDDDTKGSMATCIASCGGCCWTILVLVYYILGIIWISTPGKILDGNGCSLIY